MRLRKLFAIAVSSGVLGAQLWTIAPPFDVAKAWYWPFMNYPMYSQSHDAGAVFTAYELRARPCAAGRTPIVVSAHLLGIGRFKMYAMLEAIGDADSPAAAADSSMALLGHLARTRSPDPLCSLQLRAHSITVGADTAHDPERAWTPVSEWSITGARAAAPTATSDAPLP